MRRVKNRNRSDGRTVRPNNPQYYRGTTLSQRGREAIERPVGAKRGEWRLAQTSRLKAWWMVLRRLGRAQQVRVVVAVLVVGWFSWHSYVAGVDVRFEGGQVATTPVEEFVTDYLNENPLRRLVFFTDHNRLKQELEARSPSLQSVDVRHSWLTGKVVIEGEPRVPVVRWQSGDQLYGVDERGILFQSSNPKQLDSLPKLVDSSGIEAKPGTRVISQYTINFIRTVISEQARLDLEVTEVKLPATIRMLEFSVAGKPYVIRYATDKGVGEQVNALVLTQRELKKSGSEPAQYIDVRVPGRVYYR